MIKINKEDIMHLLWMARRYADGRSTYAPSLFNDAYDRIMSDNPELKAKDTADRDNANWPYAQDGMHNKETGHFDATADVFGRPRKHKKEGKK